MERSFIYNDTENLTYEDLDYKFSNVKEEYEAGMQIYGKNHFKIKNKEKKYSKGEIENILKQGIEDLIVKIKNIMEKHFCSNDIITSYNKYIDKWNEVLCNIMIKGKQINVKLVNDYRCDDYNNISSVYIKIFSNGKDIFTECIERINQDYEFISSTYDYVPVNENELYFKRLDADKIIECIVFEINKFL